MDFNLVLPSLNLFTKSGPYLRFVFSIQGFYKIYLIEQWLSY